jgi:hypothetical protein
MANKRLLKPAFTIATMALIFALALAGCSNPTNDTSSQEEYKTYTAYDEAGSAFILVVTETDTYVLSIQGANGNTLGTSTGTVIDFNNNSYNFKSKSGGTFTVIINISIIVQIPYPVPLDNGGTKSPEGPLSPSKPGITNPGGNENNDIVGTWVCTVPADLHSFTLNSDLTCTLNWGDREGSIVYIESGTYSVSGDVIDIITPARPDQFKGGRITGNTITFYDHIWTKQGDGSDTGGGQNNSLNGTWVGPTEDGRIQTITFNNGNWEQTTSPAKGTYTTNGNTLTVILTHYLLEGRWYTVAELIALGYLETGDTVLIITYSVNGDRLTMTNSSGTYLYTRM